MVFLFLLIAVRMQAQVAPKQNEVLKLQQLKKEVSDHYFSNGKQAMGTADEAIKLAYQLRDTAALADLLKMYGVMLYFGGEHQKALENYFKSLHFFRAKKDLKGCAGVYNEIGTLYKKNNRLNEAQTMFDNSYQLSLQIKDTTNMASALNNGGIVNEMRNDLNAALNSYQKALKLYVLIADTIGQSYCYENIGGVYLMQKNFGLSEQFLIKSLNFRIAKKMDQPIAFSYYYLGDLYQQKGDYLKAIQMFEKALKMAEKLQYPDLQQRSYYALSDAHKQVGAYERALMYYTKATTIKDSLFNAMRSQQLSEIQTKYEVENKVQENTLLKQKLELEGQKARNRNLILLVFLISLLLLVIGGLFYYKRRQNELELQTQNKIQKAEQEQRLRISHDLHDHVGAQLSYVVSNLDIANSEFVKQHYDTKRLQSVTEMSKQAILTLRETVWALSHEAISIEAFSDKLKAYALKMSEYSTNLEVVIKDYIEQNETLPPNTALHLFRICQEAFNNALKHANASHISIEIYSNKMVFFQFVLKDDGKGFNIEAASKKGHYGLLNMQHRAAEIGAMYSLETEETKGTQIQITLPIKNTTYA